MKFEIVLELESTTYTDSNTPASYSKRKIEMMIVIMMCESNLNLREKQLTEKNQLVNNMGCRSSCRPIPIN